MPKPLPILDPPEKSGAGASLQTTLAQLLEELRRAAKRAGVVENSPLAPMISAFVLVLEWLGACIAELRGISVEYGSQALQRLQAIRAADEAATTRMQTQMEAAKVRILHDFRHDLARDFDKLTAGRVRSEIWKISLVAALVLTASIATSLAVGYRWGRAGAEASIHETESRLIAAFRDGLPGASHWVGLMSWNDVMLALEQCHERPGLVSVQHDRRACYVPLWIEPEKGAPDAVLDDIISEARRLQEQAHAPEPQNQAGPEDAAPLKPGSAQQRPKSSR